MKSGFVQHTAVVTQMSTSSFGGFKPRDHTTEFANKQLPLVANREQNGRLCSSLKPFLWAKEKHRSEFWNCFKVGTTGKWATEAGAHSSWLGLVCQGNQI